MQCLSRVLEMTLCLIFQKTCDEAHTGDRAYQFVCCIILILPSKPPPTTMQDLRASITSTSALNLQDENCSGSSSFSSMTQAFSQRIAELQQLVCFRVEGEQLQQLQSTVSAAVPLDLTQHVWCGADNVKHIFVRDIHGIEVR